LTIVVAVGVAAILWVLKVSIRIDKRAVPLQPSVEPRSATRAKCQLAAADLAALHQVVREPDALPKLRWNQEWFRASAKAAPDGEIRVVLDPPMTLVVDSLRSPRRRLKAGIVKVKQSQKRYCS
jgi:hypothetical protein